MGWGGSSSINAMNFLRGHRASYDAWGAAGAKGWEFDDLLRRALSSHRRGRSGGQPDKPVTRLPGYPRVPKSPALKK
jgi:choline dehydrogenase-like flavoprotein